MYLNPFASLSCNNLFPQTKFSMVFLFCRFSSFTVSICIANTS